MISANGPVTLYLGNNRDAAGIGQYSLAFKAAHERVNRGEITYIGQTWTDIHTAPRRWLGLMIRKAALYFGDLEIPNNVDFYTEGTMISPLLRALPLRFGGIVALGLTGLSLGLAKARHHQPGVWLLGVVLLVLFSTTIMFHVVSRFRVPTYGPLIVLSAFLFVEIGQSIANHEAWASLRALGFLGSTCVLVMTLPWIADHSMPPPRAAEIPAGSVPLYAPFSETLVLAGYDALPAVEPGEPLFITLYWQADAPLALDYYGTVQLFAPNGEKLAQSDHHLGTGSFPHYLATDWQPSETVKDQYLLFPPRDTQTPIGLRILVAAYDRQTGARLGEAVIAPLPLTRAEPLNLPEGVTPVNASIGSALLAAYEVSITDKELIVTLFWESKASTSVNGVVFVHLFDTNENFVLGKDTSPRRGEYPMTAWQHGEGVTDPHHIPLDELPDGQYTMVVGVYDPATGERLPIVDSAGHAVPSGNVELGDVDVPGEA